MTGVGTENRNWDFLNEERGEESKSNYDRTGPTQYNKWLSWQNTWKLATLFVRRIAESDC